MRKSKFSKQQQLDILAEWDAGAKVEDLCRKHQVSSPTLYNWRKVRTTESDDQLRELADLRKQNERLKKMYAELSIDHGILQEGYQMLKKWQAQDAKSK